MKKSLYWTTSFALIFLGATLFFISSCSKTDIPAPSLEDNIESSLEFTNQIEIKDGIMYFPTQELYEYTLEWLFEHQKNLTGFANKFPSFKSAHQAYDEIDFSQINPDALTKEQANFLYIEPFDDESFDVLPVLDAHLLSQIVNHEGLIWVGSSIFKHKYEEVIEVTSDNLIALRNDNITSTDIVKILPITRTFYQLNEDGVSVDMREERESTCLNHYHRVNDRAWKFKVEGALVQRRSSNVSLTLEALTRHRKRCTFGAWCKEENGIGLKVKGSFRATSSNQAGTITTGSIDFDQTGVGHTFSTTLLQCFCTDLVFVATSGTHTVTRSDDGEDGVFTGDPEDDFRRCFTFLP